MSQDSRESAIFQPPVEEVEVPRRPLIARILLTAFILAFGAAAMTGIAMLRSDPPPAEPEEAVARTSGIRVARQDVQAVLRGYGTARPRRTTRIAPQVSGVVVEAHPRLQTGNVIAEGEVLFRIDPKDFELNLTARRAEVERLEALLRQLDRERQNDERRLEVAERLREIARREYDRIEQLVRQSGAESEARLDSARSALEREEQNVLSVENALALYESRVASTEAQLASGRSAFEQAELDLDRTTVRAPFHARIRDRSVEVGQRVTTGAEVLTLADDRILEIPVSLDSREVAGWLDVLPEAGESHWFDAFNDHPVLVRWTENPERLTYEGYLDRVEDYNARSRTFHVVAAIDQRRRNSNGEIEFPLTEGMFVEVEIPGRIARDVVPIPRDAIDSQGNVFVGNDGRLESRAVRVARFQEGVALIASGLENGDIVLTRRPPQPIEGMRVEVRLLESDGVLTEQRD